jgi:5-methylcytosine-specific restriction protein A
MPQRPARPCRQPNCPHLSYDGSGYCQVHLRQHRQQIDRARGTAAQRGYDARWQRYRREYLIEHPLCVNCLRANPPVIREATVVDHIKPHKGDYKLFWSPSNHQALCKQCHNIKTASEDGAFGNEKKLRG